MVTGVVGITIWTENLEPMLRFYEDKMRLPLHSNHGDFVAFDLGGVRFNLGLHGSVSGAIGRPLPNYAAPRRWRISNQNTAACPPQAWNLSVHRSRSTGEDGWQP